MQISSADFLLPIDVLAFADIFAALAEERPYRENKNKEEIKEILKTFISDKLDANIYKVLIEHFDELYTLQEKVRNDS